MWYIIKLFTLVVYRTQTRTSSSPNNNVSHFSRQGTEKKMETRMICRCSTNWINFLPVSLPDFYFFSFFFLLAWQEYSVVFPSAPFYFGAFQCSWQMIDYQRYWFLSCNIDFLHNSVVGVGRRMRTLCNSNHSVAARTKAVGEYFVIIYKSMQLHMLIVSKCHVWSHFLGHELSKWAGLGSSSNNQIKETLSVYQIKKIKIYKKK